MGLFNKRNLAKAKALAEKNKEKIASGVNKATDTIDKKTGGKHTDKLKKIDDAAKKFAGDETHAGTGTPAGTGTTTASGTTASGTTSSGTTSSGTTSSGTTSSGTTPSGTTSPVADTDTTPD